MNPADPYVVPVGGLGAFNYSPPIARLFGPFGSFEWPSFLWVWLALLIGNVVWLGGRGVRILWILAFPPVAIEIYHGNIHLWIAAAIALGFRYPWTWGFVLLTKVTPGIGLLWFAVRREWRALGIALGVTGAIVAVSLILQGQLWVDWLGFIFSTPEGGSVAQFHIPIPLWLRLPAAAGARHLGRAHGPALDGGGGGHHRAARPVDQRLRDLRRAGEHLAPTRARGRPAYRPGLTGRPSRAGPVLQTQATTGTRSIGTSWIEYARPPPRELATAPIQSIHMAPNGRLSSTMIPSASHDDRRVIPMRENGNRLGLISTSMNDQRYRHPSATAATTHITGLPVAILTIVGGHRTHSAMIGQAIAAGRIRHTTQAVTPSGTSHQTAGGSTTNGAKSQRSTGGYRMSPALIGYGPASWYG